MAPPDLNLNLALNLNHCFLVVAGHRGLNKKPTTVASRGFLSKFNLTTTSANGVANDNDDDRQNNSLSRVL